MSIHTVGYESLASATILSAITPIPDGTVQIQNNDVFVPKGMNNLIAVAAAYNTSNAATRVEVQAPSLRAILNFDVSPFSNGLVFGTLPRMSRLWNIPLQLVDNEPLDVFCADAANNTVRTFLWLADGPPKPTTGRIYTVRATGTAALATNTWANTPVTFAQALPAGHYQCVGFRCVSTNGVCARIFFKNSGWRPGVPCAANSDQDTWNDFRFGNIGVWGEFDNTVPPSVDVMGVTDTAQSFLFDLIKTA